MRRLLMASIVLLMFAASLTIIQACTKAIADDGGLNGSPVTYHSAVNKQTDLSIKSKFYICREVGSVANYLYVEKIANPTPLTQLAVDEAPHPVSFDNRQKAEKAIEKLEAGYYFVLEVFKKE